MDSSQQPVEGWSCTISTHMRSLGKVLATFDKIGRDLTIQAAPDRLLLRTLNQAQSVFCLCTLPMTLFDHFEVGEDTPNAKIFLKVRARAAGALSAARMVGRAHAAPPHTPLAAASHCPRLPRLRAAARAALPLCRLC
jgi:hypothetical protein